MKNTSIKFVDIVSFGIFPFDISMREIAPSLIQAAFVIFISSIYILVKLSDHVTYNIL